MTEKSNQKASRLGLFFVANKSTKNKNFKQNYCKQFFVVI